MKVVAFNGSPRSQGNTSMLLGAVLVELAKEGIETELVQLGGKSIRGCTACMKCFENQDKHCAIDNDVLNEMVDKMVEADGIIVGSPTYFSNVSAEVKALIDRAGMVAIANGHMFKRKVGAAVVAVRRAGSTDTFDAINKLFFINQMIVPGSVYWNMGFGLQPGEVAGDEEGMNTMKILGENMGWLLKKLG
ncbi:flavodoxin family protein [Verrucomicrobiota bacterium]